jgi:exodeoxyribonuclease V alpha subunit
MTTPLSRLGAARAAFAAARDEPLGGDGLDALAAAIDMTGHDVDGETAFLAAELVGWQPGLDDHDRRALMVLVIASLVAVRSGSTRLPLTPPARARSLAAALLPGEGVALVDRALALIAAGRASALVGADDGYRPLVIADGSLYHQRMLAAERRLVGELHARLAAPPIGLPQPAIDAALAAVRADGRFRLSAEQVGAVRAALERPFSVISGGPGTGKTAIIVSILRALARLGVPTEDVALAAPTGKAAQRMQSSIASSLGQLTRPELFDLELLRACPPPQTLHRLLGYSPRADRFHHHEHNKLAQRVVIVDEGSMIDLTMMERLLGAVRDDARLVLLGDADQLPSVDSGAVLRDLVPPRGGPAVRLTRSYRMDPADPAGRAILTLARNINGGRGPGRGDAAELIAARDEIGALRYHGVEQVDAGADLDGFCAAWHDARRQALPQLDRRVAKIYRWRDDDFADGDRADLAALFAQLDHARILTVTRGRRTGARAVNQRLHDLALTRSALDRRPDFCPGEPVMMRENDYDRGIFNGDQGLVLRVAERDGAPHFRAVFPRPASAPGHAGGAPFRVFHLDALRDQLELAYAMTVHKSQGSEFDHVALILPEVDLPILTRELLYTACTRARRSVAIIGSRAVFDRGVARRTERSSGVARALAGD